MGRTKPKKQALSKAVDSAIQSSPAKTPSISSLLEKAQSLIVQCDYDLATKFIHRILEKQPSNVEAREMLGVVQLETGEIEAAQQVYKFLLLSYLFSDSIPDVLKSDTACTKCAFTPSSVCTPIPCPNQ